MISQPKRHWSWFWLAALLLGLVSAVFALWVALRVGGSRMTDAVDDIGELVAALVAAGACGVAAYRLKSARAGWALLSASSFAWAAGETVWSYYDLGRGVQVPFPSLADVGFLAAVPLAIAGLLRFPCAARSRASDLRGLLDGLLIGGSVFFVSWVTVLGPLYRHHQGGVLTQSVSLAYPVSDIVIASLVVILATRPGTQNRMSLGLVLIGMLAFALADSSFAYLTTVKSYGIGNVLDTGWVVGYFLIALGALRALSHPTEPTSERSHPTVWTILGPYLPTTMAGGVFVWRVATHQPLRAVAALAGLGVVLVMSVRQVLVLFDNLALTRQLEARIEERTAELHHQAFHDGLTGLANRALFNQYLSNAVRRRTRSGAALAVLFIDLDGFKRVNDLHGHGVGDSLLRMLASRFQKTLREADTIARLGGDEFAILLEGEPLASDPGRVAYRLLKCMERPFRIGTSRLTLQASIGISTDQVGYETPEELLRNADLAMYTAKANGKHSYEIYAREMHSVILERMRTEAELRSALEHDEFVLHYQPVMELATGAIQGVEALIRWNHPRRGLLHPDEFISIADATRLIVPIGAWVLRQACLDAQARILRTDQQSLWLSVNLSTPQLEDEHLIATVSAALADSGMDPDRLTLEITESMIMDDLSHAIVVLKGLRDLGVKIAIDDFGTGYSSLSALRDLPLDTLKIDRSFVTSIAQRKASADLARRIFQLATDFHLHTVAEGVEQQDQLEVLQRLGCESIQGFLFSRPLAAADLDVFLQRASSDEASVSVPEGALHSDG